MNTNHTPGPWKARHVSGRYGNTYCIDWSEDKEEVAEVVHGEANAKLMAAAPLLLDALQCCLSVLHNIDSVDLHWAGAAGEGLAHQHDAIDTARAAIAAATN